MNIYWVTTGLLSAFLLWSAYAYLFLDSMIEGVAALGFPNHFRILLASLKILAVLLILIPAVPSVIKDWSYAGIFFFFVTAIVAHIAHQDSPLITLVNLAFIALLMVSYWQFKINS